MSGVGDSGAQLTPEHLSTASRYRSASENRAKGLLQQDREDYFKFENVRGNEEYKNEAKKGSTS